MLSCFVEPAQEVWKNLAWSGTGLVIGLLLGFLFCYIKCYRPGKRS